MEAFCSTAAAASSIKQNHTVDTFYTACCFDFILSCGLLQSHFLRFRSYFVIFLHFISPVARGFSEFYFIGSLSKRPQFLLTLKWSKGRFSIFVWFKYPLALFNSYNQIK